MADTMSQRCDGCGQAASPEHIAKRLRRLEWSTRCRPVHINALLLGAFAPEDDSEFLYSPREEFRGEAAQLLGAVGIATAGKTADSVQTEFQRAGFFFTHVLECAPMSEAQDQAGREALLVAHLPAAASRIRRSLRPRRVILVTEALLPVLQNILALDLGCPVLLHERKPFDFGALAKESDLSQFREKLAGTVTG